MFSFSNIQKIFDKTSHVSKYLSCKHFWIRSSQNVRCYSKSQYNSVDDVFINRLCTIVGEKNVSTSLALRQQSGADESYHGSSPADVVVFPHSTKDISSVTKLCYESIIPIVPRGTGTGLEHGVGALQGGVCIDVSRMTNVLEVNEEDFDCTVEPGVTRKALASYLRESGLMFPVDPGADASLGGMASTSASGTNAVKYGTMKENVINLEVVLPDGSVLHTAGQNRRTRKSAAGFNLTELFVGSEGTLGIISKVTLRLHAVPAVMASAVCSFPSVGRAVESVVEILQNSIPIARIELLDEVSMQICASYSGLEYPAKPSLFLEFHGSEESVKAQADMTEGIVKSNEGSDFKWSSDGEERNKLWKARHEIYWATLAYKPGSKCIITDVCVPISKLTEIISETKEDITKAGILGSVIGHVGDGNFHAQLLYDPKNPKEKSKALELEHKIASRALSLNGTCTGEHGIGIGKISHLQHEYGDIGIRCMRDIKRALDPLNIMNPGKIIPVMQ